MLTSIQISICGHIVYAPGLPVVFVQLSHELYRDALCYSPFALTKLLQEEATGTGAEQAVELGREGGDA